mgnify:CR=1 FL=1
MALEANVLDYVGRSVDLLAFDGMNLDSEALLIQQLVYPGSNGALISGVQKLAQRFLLELLTESSSLQYLPKRGCAFMLEARLGIWRTPADVESAYYSSLLDVKRNLILEEADTDPLDERFASADLISLSLTADKAVAHIQVSSQAGVSRKVIFPLRINNLNRS